MNVDVLPELNGSGHRLDDVAAVVNRFTLEPLPPCRQCGKRRERGPWTYRGFCSTCYRRWSDHGFRGDEPPRPDPYGDDHGWLINDPHVLADFARLDKVPGRSAELARRFGVSRRTLTRWRRRIEQIERRRALLALARSSCGRERWRARLRSTTGRDDDARAVAAVVAAQICDQTTSSVARVAHMRA